ncbi:MAG: hypothetical protein MZV65_28645 [Chromatiales bacterium]|nr:hypothetical protein [Chromatiales bacterium]
MAITLSTTGAPFVLPQGLRWTDEYAWTSVAQSIDYGLTGALLIQEGTRIGGRPLTLTGGKNWAWITRAQLDTLRALLESVSARTLTLHDGRRFSVIPSRESDGPLSVTPVPIVRDSGPADPSGATKYVLETVRFLILDELGVAL